MPQFVNVQTALALLMGCHLSMNEYETNDMSHTHCQLFIALRYFNFQFIKCFFCFVCSLHWHGSRGAHPSVRRITAAHSLVATNQHSGVFVVVVWNHVKFEKSTFDRNKMKMC